MKKGGQEGRRSLALSLSQFKLIKMAFYCEEKNKTIEKIKTLGDTRDVFEG